MNSLINRQTLERHDLTRGCDEAYLDEQDETFVVLQKEKYDKTDILIDRATVGEFKHYCRRFCRLCNIENGNGEIKPNKSYHKNDRAMACPIIQFEAYRQLMKEGGVNAVSLNHSKKVREIIQKLHINKAGAGVGDI